MLLLKSVLDNKGPHTSTTEHMSQDRAKIIGRLLLLR